MVTASSHLMRWTNKRIYALLVAVKSVSLSADAVSIVAEDRGADYPSGSFLTPFGSRFLKTTSRTEDIHQEILHKALQHAPEYLCNPVRSIRTLASLRTVASD